MTFGPADEASASFMVIEELVKLCGRNFEPVNVPIPTNFVPGCFVQYGSVSEKKRERKEEEVKKREMLQGKRNTIE